MAKNTKALWSDVYAVILVGGKGKRLRPLSTDEKPKAFLSITSDRKTMFRRAVNRISKIIPVSNIVVVANEAHLSLVKKDFPEANKDQLILEPISRNTAPAIMLAALNICKMDRNAIMVVLPADQYIMDEEIYLKAFREGIEFVKNNGSQMVVLGLKPKDPTTGYGYIRVKKGCRGNVCKVDRFVEKPDLDTAKKYVKSGSYMWNTGAFIFKAGTIIAAIERFEPYIAKKMSSPEVAHRMYEDLPDISIDYAVMERADNIYCIKGSYGWQDMGNFVSIRQILKREGRKYIEKEGVVTKIL